MKLRKYLSADALFKQVREGIEKIKDYRDNSSNKIKISLADALMSAFAMFSLKDASLLAFEDSSRNNVNLKTIYHINEVPCDTQMRTILDDVSVDDIAPLYRRVFSQLQRGNVLNEMAFDKGRYLVSVDGTGYFSSKEIHCSSCLEKKNSKTGAITYHHQMLGAVVVHSDFKEVIPLMPEPIIKQDGESKNDCERNASKRFFERLRREHPHLPIIITEDSLSSNVPHLAELEKHKLDYIIGVKEGDHAFLFNFIRNSTLSYHEYKVANTLHCFRFINQVPLNESNQDKLVNFLEYWEIKGDKIQHFSWIISDVLRKDNVYKMMRGGRTRWKVENETFNTLKNQNYNFEHNYGHGKKNLSVIFALLMMLVFLVDQAQQLSCSLFQAVWKKSRSKRNLWRNMRSLFHSLEFDSMESIFSAMLYGYKKPRVEILNNTS